MGAQYGALAILHTWGQKMSLHPHIHLGIPAGGISEDSMEWRSTRKKFFAPVRAMSETFKEKFCCKLKAQLDKCNLSVPNRDKFNALISAAEEKNWVVFAQEPFSKPQHIIDYLGNYTHRVAISNSRLIKLEEGHVHFYYKDYHQNGKRKKTKLPVMEFIRRFLQHVLPFGFRKIRYFGFYANRFKSENLALARECIKREGYEDVVIKQSIEDILSEIEFQLNKITGTCPCPCCGGEMVPLSSVTEMLQAQVEDST